jgi:DinB family protein
MVREKEEMLAELREVRERSLAFLSATREQDLRNFCWPHPFLGMLNTYEWFKMIGSHEIRHTKQMNEIALNLPKLVATGQKRDEFTN